MKGMARLLIVCLALPAAAATRTWTGSASNVWSNAANWGGTAPVAGDDLVFPASASNLTNSNDLGAGFLVQSITVSGAGYKFNGASIALGAGGMNVTAFSGGGPIFNIPISLIAPQQWTSGGNYTIALNGSLSGSSNLALTGPAGFLFAAISTTTGTLSNNGPGGVAVDAGGNAWPGPVVMNDGVAAINVNSAVGPMTVNNAALQVGGFGAGGPESTGNLALNSLSFLEGFLQFNPTIAVIGTVTMTNSTLDIFTGNNVFAAGTTFTLIDNDGSDAISGTFNGIPEGGTVMGSNGQPFKVTYAGGTGNDLVLTAGLTPSTTALAPSANPATLGQSVTFTATVVQPVSGPPKPAGTVTFYDGVTPIGTGSVSPSGQATFTTSSLTAGSHSITATYGGSTFYATSTSPIVVESVASPVPALDPRALAILALLLAVAGMRIRS